LKGIVLLVLGFAFIGAGIFLIRRARATQGTVDRQLSGQPDTWYDFMDRINMFGFGFGMFAFSVLSFYKAFQAWFGGS